MNREFQRTELLLLIAVKRSLTVQETLNIGPLSNLSLNRISLFSSWDKTKINFISIIFVNTIRPKDQDSIYELISHTQTQFYPLFLFPINIIQITDQVIDFQGFLSMQKQKNQQKNNYTINQIFSDKQAVSITINKEEGESVTFYAQDYESLQPSTWLRTQALDLIIKLLLQKEQSQIRRFFASRNQFSPQKHKFYMRSLDAFIVTLIMMDQEDFILESLEPLRIFSKQTKYLLIPVNTQHNLGNHWFLGLLINEESKYRLIIFDSTSSNTGGYLLKRIEHLYRILMKSQMKIELQSAQNLIHQSNYYDCGIFTIAFSEYIMKEVVNELEQGRKIELNNLNSRYKYLISNSQLARQRYRKIAQEAVISSIDWTSKE